MKKTVQALLLAINLVAPARANLADYSAYFPFDDSAASAGGSASAIKWDEAGPSPDLDASVKVAGAASSHALKGGSGWIITDESSIKELIRPVFTFSVWVRFDEGRKGLIHLLREWTGSETSRVFSLSLFSGFEDRHGVESVLQGTAGTAGGDVHDYQFERGVWYHLIFLVNTGVLNSEYRALTIFITPMSDDVFNAKPVREHSFLAAGTKLALCPSTPLTLQSSRDVDSTCCGCWIDEAVFYPRALTQEEMTELFSLGKQGKSLPPPAK